MRRALRRSYRRLGGVDVRDARPAFRLLKGECNLLFVHGLEPSQILLVKFGEEPTSYRWRMFCRKHGISSTTLYERKAEEAGSVYRGQASEVA